MYLLINKVLSQIEREGMTFHDVANYHRMDIDDVMDIYFFHSEIVNPLKRTLG
jgi:hypothetical protein